MMIAMWELYICLSHVLICAGHSKCGARAREYGYLLFMNAKDDRIGGGGVSGSCSFL